MSNKARCRVSVASLTVEPNFHSPLVSQLLFGEYCEILSQEGAFFHIRSLSDGVEGWIFHLNLESVEAFIPQNILTKPFEWRAGQLLSFGSESTENFWEQSLPFDEIGQVAQRFVGVPYLSGGRSFFGIDADGFSQLVYKSVGVSLPRKSSEQVEYGVVLDFIEESRAGDLAFFENEYKEIDHIGIMLDSQKVIHAFGEVRIDDLDISGIYNKDLKKHTHKLRCVKRLYDAIEF